MSHHAITVENLSKVYRIGVQAPVEQSRMARFKRMVRAPLKNLRDLHRLNIQNLDEDNADPDILWALKNVSFDVRAGEVIGVIGRNGAGKSTLLKLLSRITEPTSGRITFRGRISSLLEVGTGFHPELTGRENVYMNGTILGMSKREIDKKFDEIVEFSGVSRFLDTPTKRYSSGMQVRLAFSVAAHLEPEILIIDEVLAVGDAEFQRKCIAKMQDVASGGRTVFFVSHNLAAVRQLCQRGIMLSEGRVVADGDVETVLNYYCAGGVAAAQIAVADRTDRGGNGEVQLNEVAIHGNNGGDILQVGDSAGFRFVLRGDQPHSATCSFTIYDEIGTAITGFASRRIPEDGWRYAESGDHYETVVQCEIEKLPLVPGPYSINVAVQGEGVLYDHVEHAATFDVLEGFQPFGIPVRHWVGRVLVPHGWTNRTEIESTLDAAAS